MMAALAVASGASPPAQSGRSDGYPNFCAIPPRPIAVRAAPEFKQAVVAVRLAGRDLERRTAPASWSLTGAEAFAAEARAEAAPPPPIPGDDTDTAAFVAAARAAVRPPRR